MGKTRTDSVRLVLKETGSTSRVVNPSDSISAECLIDVTLPHELITEILVRLPVRSLFRFKCVSKPWLSLISTPQFIRSHLSKSSSMEADELNLELLISNRSGMKKCCLYSALYQADPSKLLPAIEFPYQFHDSIVGIINGLVCLNLKGNDFCLWNPALNKIKHLNVHPVAPSGPRSVNYFYSFGYDESHDDYKVVCLGIGIDDFPDANAFIYSLKAGSWTRIDRLRGCYPPGHGMFANGKIYWSGAGLHATPKRKIFSLDMSSEKFVEMQYPQYDAREFEFRMGVSGGRLVMYFDYQGKLDLWVLDKHGVEESWSKFVSFPYDYAKESFYFDRILCILRNGDIFFGDGYDFLVYNWKEKKYRRIQLADTTDNWTVSAYVESLIWPDYA